MCISHVKPSGNPWSLFVDANGAYSRKQALALAGRFAGESNVSWFEEPRPSDDLEGLRLLRDRGPAVMDIAAGEYGDLPGYFLRMLQVGAVDCLQADATRCGGYTGFLKVAALCEAFQMPLSAHCAPQLHAHVGCAVPGCGMSNFFTTTTASTGFFLKARSNRKKAGYIPIGPGQDTGWH